MRQDLGQESAPDNAPVNWGIQYKIVRASIPPKYPQSIAVRGDSTFWEYDGKFLSQCDFKH